MKPYSPVKCFLMTAGEISVGKGASSKSDDLSLISEILMVEGEPNTTVVH